MRTHSPSAPYSALPDALYRAEQVRQLDRYAIEALGIPGIELMNRAGAAAFDVLQHHWPAARRVVVLCGGGNNGGDGYVVAQLAHSANLAVEVYTPPGLADPSGDARIARDAWEAEGGRVATFNSEVLDAPAVVVDGLLGTGLEREVRGGYAEIIDAVNRSGYSVLALDIPSGLSADTGMPLGVSIQAAATVTFVGLKQGLCTGRAVDLVGELRFSDLAISAEAYHQLAPAAVRIGESAVNALLEPRPRSSHKGDNGHVLVVGGDAGMSGAVRMAAEAAARVGAGWVSVATRASHAAWINLNTPEVMSHSVEEAAALTPLLDRATVVAIGPGLGRSEWANALLDAVIESGKPLVVDADGLNLLASKPRRCDRWILTPHPGEAARLLDGSVAEIQSDRFKAVDALRQKYGGTVILKGAGTLVGLRDGSVSVCTQGNPGMASGGMGDVLTGVIAGLWAQGLSADRTAEAGVSIHARAADLAAAEGERGLLATDLMSHLWQLVNPHS